LVKERPEPFMGRWPFRKDEKATADPSALPQDDSPKLIVRPHLRMAA
jgi:hypothetical protein